MQYLLRSLAEAGGLLVRFDPEVWRIVLTSLAVSGSACVLAAAAGIPAGLAIALNRFRGRAALLLVLNTLMALPTVVVGLILYGLLGRQGPLGPLGILFTPAGIILGQFVLALPIVTNLTVAAVRGMDPRLFLTCRSLGARGLHLASAVVREGRYGIVAAVVASFGRVIAEVGIAMMVGGNIKGFTRTMTTAVALETSRGEFELALALGIVLMTVAFLVNGALFALQGRGR